MQIGHSVLSLHSRFWEHSSVGSEHLPYKQRVLGSNPCAPTQEGVKLCSLAPFFMPYKPRVLGSPPARGRRAGNPFAPTRKKVKLNSLAFFLCLTSSGSLFPHLKKLGKPARRQSAAEQAGNPCAPTRRG